MKNHPPTSCVFRVPRKRKVFFVVGKLRKSLPDHVDKIAPLMLTNRNACVILQRGLQIDNVVVVVAPAKHQVGVDGFLVPIRIAFKPRKLRLVEKALAAKAVSYDLRMMPQE